MITNDLNRRRVVQLLGGAGALALAGCATKLQSSGTTSTTTTSTPSTSSQSSSTGSSSATGTIPEETASPYPGDGSNGVNVLAQGVQPADADGVVTFTSIYPACYSGRWPHVHFEVYASVADATASSSVLATSQIALTEDVCDTVYATSGYEQSRTNMSQVSLASDNVFSDGVGLETPTVAGSVDEGYVVTLPVRVA